MLYPGDRLFNESKIVLKQFFGSRTSIDRASAVRRRVRDGLGDYDVAIPSGQLADVGDLLMQAVKIRADYTTAKYGVKPREGRLV